MSPTDQTVITCGRCGRANTGTHAVWGDNGNVCMEIGSWEEPGWVFFRSAVVTPLRAGFVSAIYTPPCSDEYVCPGCILDEERPQAEPYETIVCGRCGKENLGGLDEFRYRHVVEWEEPDWIEYEPATVRALDGSATEQVLGQGHGVVCGGCQTAEEHDQLEAIVWEVGGPEQ